MTRKEQSEKGDELGKKKKQLSAVSEFRGKNIVTNNM